MCAVDMSGCGHVKDPSLRPMAVFPSGPCVAFKRMCRKCPPQLSTPGCFWPGDCSPAETDPTEMS